MKDSLLLPFYIAAMFLLVFVLLAGGTLIYFWNTNFAPDSPPQLSWAVQAAPTALLALFPLAVITTLFLAFIRLSHSPGVPFLSFLLALLATGALLYFGYPLLVSLAHDRGLPVERSYNPLDAGSFNSLDSATIYPQKVNGFRLSQIVVSRASADPRFEFLPQASYDPAAHELRPAAGGTAIPVVPPNPTYSPVFAPGPVLGELASDVAALNADIAVSYRSPLRLYPIECGGLLLLAMGCFLFTRVSRWPLLNAFFTLAAFRGFFRLNALMDAPVTTRVAEAMLPKDLISVAPAIGLGSLGVLLILLQLLFIGRDNR